MESKDSNMGLPAGAITSSGTPMSVMHNGNSEALGTPVPAISHPTMPTPAHAPSITAGAPIAVAPLAATPAPTSFQIPSSTPPPYMPNMSTSIVPVSTGGFAALGLDSMKKKRGRPRKYGPDGSLALSVTPLLTLSPSSLSPSQKRGRGRPLGSGKNQQLAALGELMLGSIGAGFTPHAITVATGEDIASRIMSFSQQGPRGICILSANGAISSVTLRQPSISGGIITYEGRFEILSLSGSFLLTDFAGARSRTGGLSVSLAGPDGRVVGGGVAGVLIAASPVQVIVGSFMCNTKRLLPKLAKTEGGTKPAAMNATKPATTMTPNAATTMTPNATKTDTMTPNATSLTPNAATMTPKLGADASIMESESKPAGVENTLVGKGTTGGSAMRSDAASPAGQAMPPQNTSPSDSQMISEEKHLDNKNPLPG